MIKSNFIAISSPNQLEVKIPYHSESNIRKIDYHTNIYFFVPKSLNINPAAYTNSNFYNDYISYICFITPQKRLGVLERELTALIELLETMEYDTQSKNTFEEELKLIICSYISYLGKYRRGFAHKGIRIKRLHTFLQRIKNFHSLMKKLLKTAHSRQDNNIIDCVLSASEYLSYAVQNCLLEINVHLKTHDDKYNATINTIVGIINTVIAFSKENSFPVISNDPYQNEKVIYRHSILKKYFYSTLYLYQKKKKDGGGIKEIYYAIAAGLSMIFTTLIVFATQKEYGNFTTSFFAALVISYMFKDRIKEAYRGYFDKRMAIKSYDYKEKIYSTDKKLIFAFIKERMRFIEKKELEADIQKMRLIEVPGRLSSYLEEDIIKFEKNVTLYNKNIQKKYKNSINGIHNIMRFDISQYLKKMSAAKVPLYRIHDQKLFGNKIYHINIVIENKTESGTNLYRARIIINKRGIKRIELPESGLIIFPEDNIMNKKNWFSFKKSGLLKKNHSKQKMLKSGNTDNKESP